MLFPELFGQAGKPAGSPFERPEIMWGTLGLVGALLAGAAVVYFVDRWRKQTLLKEKQSAEELTTFREMFERGEITEEEYAKLRLKVAERVKPAPETPPAAALPPVPPPQPKPWEGGASPESGPPPA